MRDDQTIEVRVAVAAVGAVALLVPAALIGVLIVGDVGWLHRIDLRVTGAGHGWAAGHPGWVRFMEIWCLVFDPNSWRVAALGLVIWLARRRAWALAVWVAATMTAGGVLGAVLKLLVGRHRPDLLDPVARASGYSFPSGHALNNALAASVFLLVLLPVFARRRAFLWAGAIVIPLITGLSRIGLGVHWTSDVVAGWLLGVAVTAATATAYLSWRSRRRRRNPHPVLEGLEPGVGG
ncbi:phosphatase PAP2 family protein [Actinoplanes sp. NPDC051411]|uniref:phosphatase PAP2 family protein n=1 Tax=Actinoplanes sp. NPDC051411 TaxID=3155522 RepID=UPI003437F740